MTPPHYSVVIVGGGQAGLSMSYYLQQLAIDHVVFEKSSALHAWRDHRWDQFCLVTPNWQCKLPGYEYRGPDPHGFMRKDEINQYLGGFKLSVGAPLREGVAVLRVVKQSGGRYHVSTSAGQCTADRVVVASGSYHVPIIPRVAERLSANILQLHSEQYRNAESLEPGAVLVVGSGQSGAQIAEDLHLAGRKVFLAVGNAPRCARFYRGKDVVDWLAEMNYYDMPVSAHPLREGVRDNTNHYVTGRDGGRDIDLRRFATQGMELFGVLAGGDHETLQFKENLRENLDEADAVYNSINVGIDKFIDAHSIAAPPNSTYTPCWAPGQERPVLNLRAAGISNVVWCVGFRPDFGWLQAPVFDTRGNPEHVRGVTVQPGLYFLGLPWLHTWGSGRFSGIARDAHYLAERIAAYDIQTGHGQSRVLR
jgi:putative flavoprotein involved in K+ transport